MKAILTIVFLTLSIATAAFAQPSAPAQAAASKPAQTMTDMVGCRSAQG